MFLIIVMVTALVNAYARPLPLKVRLHSYGYPTSRFLFARHVPRLTLLSYPLGPVLRKMAQCS